MIRDEVINEYFEWLCDLVCRHKFAESISFKKLLTYLHDTEFIFSMPRDENRAKDGMSLRWRFVCNNYADSYHDEAMLALEQPCSILEMMVALAIRCEEDIMDDPLTGDRTSQWFWGMIVNLGLGSMADYDFDRRFVEGVVERFLNREYEPNGSGGLFTVKNCDADLRDVEIWHQMCWYLDNIT